MPGRGQVQHRGRTERFRDIFLDGGLNNDLLDNSNLLDPNPDSIAEFRLLTSNYTAEYGRNGGGIISVVVKSGANQIHGSAFEFFRNRALDANDFFNIQQGLPRLDLKRNQFGATFGGPILSRIRHFFFLAYQGQRQVQAVPDNRFAGFHSAELKGNFSQAADVCGTRGYRPGCHFSGTNPFFQSDPDKSGQRHHRSNAINSMSANLHQGRFHPNQLQRSSFDVARRI